MSKQEYIIINKTHILERIEELETGIKTLSLSDGLKDLGKINAINQILSNSVPLIPEIEKAYEAGKLDSILSRSFDNPKGRYFSSLKLDI